MNDFDNFDKYMLIGFILIILGIFIGAIVTLGYTFNEFAEAQQELIERSAL